MLAAESDPILYYLKLSLVIKFYDSFSILWSDLTSQVTALLLSLARVLSTHSGATPLVVMLNLEV